MILLRRILLFFLAASTSCMAQFGGGFGPPPPITVVEYWHPGIDHYFLTANREEMTSIESGAAGAGWQRTGFAFEAERWAWCDGCAPVDRFHGTPGVGPNSHFYTENAAESAFLRSRPLGWDYEGVAFAVILPVNGQCPWGIPVHRLYNNRARFNDANHRYVTRDSERARMIARGWIDEGIHFCSQGEVKVTIRTFAIDVPPEGHIRPSHECEDETINIGPCIAVNNLPVPAAKRAVPTSQHSTLIAVTGRSGNFVFTPRPFATIGEIASEVYVVGEVANGFGFYGIHVDTRSRGSPVLSSVNPLYQFRTDDGRGGPDPRFFPWANRYPYETELSIAHQARLVRAERRSPGSEAIGHPTLELIDQRSGLHLYFTVLTWATMDLSNDGPYLARDSTTGKVIVGTGHLESPYGRNFGDRTYFAPMGADGRLAAHPGYGNFDFRIDGTEFRRVLDSARQLEPALSANPADYFVDNFHFNNEVYKDGEIGVYLGWMRLQLYPR